MRRYQKASICNSSSHRDLYQVVHWHLYLYKDILRFLFFLASEFRFLEHMDALVGWSSFLQVESPECFLAGGRAPSQGGLEDELAMTYSCGCPASLDSLRARTSQSEPAQWGRHNSRLPSFPQGPILRVGPSSLFPVRDEENRIDLLNFWLENYWFWK